MLPRLTLDHINLPARDPDGLAAWYAKTFGFTCKERFVTAPGVLIFFSAAAPLSRKDFHFGFRVESREAVRAWSEALGKPMAFEDDDFFAVRIEDPEGNLFEIYWDA